MPIATTGEQLAMQAPVLGVLADGAPGGLYQLALAGACCVAGGAVTAALALTTEHIGSRKQFGRPLAMFQAAAQHIADVYIAARTLHLAAASACWRLTEGLDAGAGLDVAADVAGHGVLLGRDRCR